MPKPKSYIDVKIEKKPNAFHFSFKISALLEKIYKSRSESIIVSEKWQGLQFYSMPKILTNDRYRSLLSQYNLFDDYGSELYNNQKFNIAFLRTVGGNGTIIFPTEIPYFEVSELMRNLKTVLSKMYEEFFQAYKIKTRFTIEV